MQHHPRESCVVASHQISVPGEQILKRLHTMRQLQEDVVPYRGAGQPRQAGAQRDTPRDLIIVF